jgi:KDO2-lipid IV(A) lauroyltransferase
VSENLKLAFPGKSNKELIKIRKKFFHHFVDIFIEMIKLFSISKTQLEKHFVYTNLEMLDELQKDGKSLILLTSHYGNWEWLIGLSSHINYKCYAAYTHVSNKYFNNKILKSRSKFGFNLKRTSRIISEIDKNYKNNVQSMYGLISDQSPQLKKAHYWSHFLGIKVPVHTGAEMLAKKYNFNLVIIETKKVKRGYYESTFILLTKEPNKFKDFQITDIFHDKLEKQIRAQPAYYFWTHKRFKHKDKAPV